MTDITLSILLRILLFLLIIAIFPFVYISLGLMEDIVFDIIVWIKNRGKKK